MGTGLVAVKPNISNVVDLGMLGLLISLMVGAVVALVGGASMLFAKVRPTKHKA